MSGSTTNRWKLGLFVSTGVLAAAGALFWLGANAYARETVRAVTYFDESVQGLDPGSAVKFRGVRIGTVREVQVATDQHHIEVVSELFEDELKRLGIAPASMPGHDEVTLLMPDMRAQVASAGITGLKFLLIDFFDKEKFPPPMLPFETRGFYLPAAPSTLKSVEDALTRMLDQAPKFGDEMFMLLQQTNEVIHQVKDEDLPASTRSLLARASEVLERGSSLLDTAEQRLGELDVEGLGGRTAQLLGDARDAVRILRRILDDAEREDGLVRTTLKRFDTLSAQVEQDLKEARVGESAASLRLSAERIADATERFAKLSDDLSITLERTRDTLDAVRELSEMLRQDPGSLLHGRVIEPRGTFRVPGPARRPVEPGQPDAKENR